MSDEPSLIGHTVPPFNAPMTSGQTFNLSNYCGPNSPGKKLVFYFYPKDDTPGCTIEGQQFRDKHQAFATANTEIFGVSRDTVKSHESFKSAQCFTFELIADVDEKLCAMFNVIKMKNMYGKQVRGIERSTFVIDADGVVRGEWRGVKVPGHVDDILAFVQKLA